MPEARATEKIFKCNPLTTVPRGRPKYRWEDFTIQDVGQMKCWPLLPEFAVSNPSEFGFFGHLKNPPHVFLRRGSERICPMSQLCGMQKNLVPP
jgi:hypothetical protein